MKNLLLTFILCLLIVVACKEDTPKQDHSFSIEISTDRFHYKGDRPWAKELVQLGNCVLNKGELHKELSNIRSFEWTSDSGVAVSNKIKEYQWATLKHYRSNRFAAFGRRLMPGAGIVNAYTIKGEWDIYFNDRANPRHMGDMIETLCHEYAHIMGYGHGSNGTHTTGVPNELGKLCKKRIGDCL